jgi:hypothetical protein
MGDITSFSATNTTNTPIVATIEVTPTYNDNGISCEGDTEQFTITVNPEIQLTSITNRTVCNNEIIAPIEFTSTATGGSNMYQWTNDNTNIGLAANGTGAITFTATNTTTAPIVATITVVPLFTLNGISCTGNPEIFSITVNPSTQINPIADQILCSGSNTNSILFSTNTTMGTTVFNWTNNNTNIGLSANGTGDISSFVAVNNTFSPLTATIAVTPTYTHNGVSCIGTTEQITITVNPIAQINPVSDITFCENTATTPIHFTTNNLVGSTTYQWTNNNPAIGIPSSGIGNISSFTATQLKTTAQTNKQ